VRIAFGAKVTDSEGKPVGTVHCIVLRPDTRQVDGLVVHQGGMRRRDVVVPLAKVIGTDVGSVIRLALKATDLDILPIFNPQEVHRGPDLHRGERIVLGGRGAALAPAPDPAYFSGESGVQEPTKPDVAKGTIVCDNTGHHIGHVESVDIAPASRAMTSIVVRHGLFAQKITVPASMIKSVTDRITLTISAEDAKRLQSP